MFFTLHEYWEYITLDGRVDPASYQCSYHTEILYSGGKYVGGDWI